MKKHLLSLVLIVSFVFAFIPRTFAEEITEPVLDMNADEIAVNETNNINEDVDNDANSDDESDDKEDDEAVVGQDDSNSEGEEENTSEPENTNLESSDDQEEEKNIEERNENLVEEPTEVKDENPVEGNENYKVTFLNGEYRLSIKGGSNISLSELLNELGINTSLSDVENISISNEEVLKIVNNENSNDFVIQSLKSFVTTEKLIVKLKDGNEVAIKVVDPDGPAHLKELNDNGDGTYTLSLEVTGESETKVETAANVNVLIVYDVSSSMISNNVTTNSNRADYAEDVVHDFVDSLRQYQNTSNPSNIQVALVTFGPTATGRQTWTSDLTSGTNGINRFFDDGVDGTVTSSHNYRSNNGTNWEHALQRAQEYLRTADGDPTFVILVTDGAPTANGANGSNPGNPAQMSYNQFYTRYGFARDEARAIQTRDNTTLFGIYAYGREADLLDDLIYYSNTGSERSGMSAATDATENYYNASDTAALNRAIESIFGKIVESLGVGSVNISDGTTSVVAHEASNEVSHLLDVDAESFEYWLTIPVVNNEFKRTDLVSGDEITYHVTDNSDGTTTVTWGSNSVTVDGSVSAGKLKYKWTEANALYNVAPPKATIENGAVKWNLESVGTLLNGVTYTVTFDVWSSQDTLDLIADLKNGIVDYDSLDSNIKKYLVKNGDSYTLLTNTETSLTWKDTRPDGYGDGSTTFNEIGPVSTKATQTLAVTKEWDNSIDGRTKTPIEIKVLKDNKEWYSFDLSDKNDWTGTANISVGIITEDEDGSYVIKTKGHDFSFGELGKDVYNWEMKSDIVHPMLINGDLIVLKRYGTDEPEGVKSYKIGDYYYIVGDELVDEVAQLTATNERRSWIDLTKTVNYDKNAAQFEDQLFTFDITVGEAGGEDVWFSVKDGDTFVTENDGLEVTGATQAEGNTGYYYATSGSTFTVKIKAGWNLRIINLLTGTTYTIEEKNIDAKFAFDKIDYTKTKYENENGEEVPYTPEIDNEKVSGEIMSTNVAYGYEYINKNVNTEIKVTKEWDDNDDVNKNRPSDVVLKLSNGTDIIAQPEKIDKGDGTWTYTYTNLPVYDEDGELIKYTLTEETVLGYKEAVITGDAKEGFVVTNTLETVSVTVAKIWDDNNNQDGIRPGSVTLTLSDGTEIVLNEDNDWTDTIKDLPKYKNKEEITYTVTETNVPKGYEVSYSEDNLTAINKHTPAKSDVVVTKVWEDESNKEGLRPEEITIHLLANGEEVDATPEISKDGDTWTITYSNLDVNENGKEIDYTVKEDTVDKYKTEIDGLTITNSREVEIINITVKKIWEDNNDQDGIRPKKIIITIMRTSEEETEKVKDIELNAGNNWSETIEGLLKYEDGIEYTYTAEEIDVPKGYEVSYSEDTFTITNTHEVETIDIIVKKVWKNDDKYIDEARPKSVTIFLYADGEKVGSAELSEDNNWEYTFEGLDKKLDAKEIEYTVDEQNVAGYDKSITGNAEEGFTVTNEFTEEFGDTEPPITGIEINNSNSTIPFMFLVLLLILEGICLRLNKQN